jgi:isopenicillin N synthase-like dioxygenase
MLPIVDLNNASASKDVTESLMSYGFGVIVNHPISAEFLDTLYKSWDDWFINGDTENFTTDAETQAGYFSTVLAETAKDSEAQDIKEYFQYWPGGELPSALEALTLEYYEALFQLSESVLNWVQADSPAELWTSLDRALGECISRKQTMVRILRYPPTTGMETGDSIRAGAHEDIDFITLLPAANKPGLEIKPKGQDWMPVHAPEGAIIINIGDMLQELTNGKLPSTTHRVVNPDPEEASAARLTAPLFCHPYPELVLSERYTAKAYLHKRLSEINPDELKPR